MRILGTNAGPATEVLALIGAWVVINKGLDIAIKIKSRKSK